MSGREIPILFSAPMVRAILEGRKTQTRRVIKPRKHASLFDGSWTDDYVLDPGNAEWRQREVRYEVGDRLWVREAFRVDPSGLGPTQIQYKADDGARSVDHTGNPELIIHADKLWTEVDQWRPSTHMPRWASRITLEVTGVKVERLQDISKEDVIAEGITERDGLPISDVYAGWHEPFAQLWDAINGGGAWDANPWVVAISFTPSPSSLQEQGT